jgi:hypothetical protein
MKMEDVETELARQNFLTKKNYYDTANHWRSTIVTIDGVEHTFFTVIEEQRAWVLLKDLVKFLGLERGSTLMLKARDQFHRPIKRMIRVSEESSSRKDTYILVCDLGFLPNTTSLSHEKFYEKMEQVKKGIIRSLNEQGIGDSLLLDNETQINVTRSGLSKLRRNLEQVQNINFKNRQQEQSETTSEPHTDATPENTVPLHQVQEEQKIIAIQEARIKQLEEMLEKTTQDSDDLITFAKKHNMIIQLVPKEAS